MPRDPPASGFPRFHHPGSVSKIRAQVVVQIDSKRAARVAKVRAMGPFQSLLGVPASKLGALYMAKGVTGTLDIPPHLAERTSVLRNRSNKGLTCSFSVDLLHFAFGCAYPARSTFLVGRPTCLTCLDTAETCFTCLVKGEPLGLPSARMCGAKNGAHPLVLGDLFDQNRLST